MPPGGPDGEPPLGRALFRIMRAMVFEDKPLPELDALPLAQLRLLMSVHHSPDATMKDFSERLNVTQSTVTQLAERLVKRGYVERRTDATDRRVVRLQVSPQGLALVGEADALRKAMHRKVWEDCTPEQQTQIMQALDILAEVAENIRAKEGRPVRPMHFPPGHNETNAELGAEQSQPVDLMTRRVRGR